MRKRETKGERERESVIVRARERDIERGERASKVILRNKKRYACLQF